MKQVDPIKDLDDVKAIYNRLNKWGNHREAELVMVGCNVALRISDLLKLKFGDVKTIQLEGEYIGYVELEEKKTGKPKRLTLNRTAMQCIKRLKSQNPDDVYLFQAKGNRVKGDLKPVSRQWISTKLIDVKDSLGLDYSLNTHSLRKTFGYHAYKRGTDINVLQKLFNHSSVTETFKYIGITDERVRDVYLSIEIGL
ncbi:tyrosine-type recombinase/integrase (plasmid) [Xenorhabdus sp. SF857]|uniref:tyrosine-type recombinase/integrase n=1 Tax=Xenorhabdus bakwenae TaxID=3026967 RepID=UPI00255809D3|nr:tyrosine-type recombinase/integrase [Xenorhabdus sp. SF857]WFQ78159.1 tyrosine-type recombinase/integrase [Xenorhabdus sp. SF857]